MSYSYTKGLAMAILCNGREFGFRHKGYQYGTDILYVYCDICGSFHVRPYFTIKKWLIIISNIVLFILIFKTYTKIVLDYIPCLLPFILIYKPILQYLWGDKNYKCKKCRNKRISVNRLSDYPSELHKYNTKSLSHSDIDVPMQLVQKRYLSYWDDDYR